MILLLTACINPGGMAYTVLDSQGERSEQYVEALRFYLSGTRFPVVFVDNSGTDISNLFADYIRNGRLECLTFHGNQDKQRGKGYGEAEIIQYALDNSATLQNNPDERIAKITGRLVVKNINTVYLTHRWLFPRRTVFCAINSDLSFPDSRFIMGNSAFFRTFLKASDRIDDSGGYYFEHALCDTLKHETHIPFSPFLVMPCIEGVSGSTGRQYENKEQTCSFMYRYARYAISQKRRFARLYR